MRAGSILIALLGVAVAGGSVFVASGMSRGAAAVTTENGAPVVTNGLIQVFVAKTDVAFGQEITVETLTVQSWPIDAVPEGAFTNFKQLIAPDTPPRYAKRALSQGELFLPSKVSDFGETVTIVQKLGSNTRAVAIQVDAVTGVGGFVAPGDRVDVLLTEGRGAELRAITILQDVQVVGVDQAADAQVVREDIARTITVEVSPQDGQKLALAQSAGQLSLTLRSLDSAQNEVLAPVTLADVLGTPAPVAVVAPAEPAPAQTIRIRRGNEESLVSLDPSRVELPRVTAAPETGLIDPAAAAAALAPALAP